MKHMINRSKTVTKRPLRINESRLNQIIKESVKKVLNESGRGLGYNEQDSASYAKYINSPEWYGVDADNEESLFEYGILIKQTADCVYSVLYRSENNDFRKVDNVNMCELAQNVIETVGRRGVTEFLQYADIKSVAEFRSLCKERPEIVLQSLNQYYGDLSQFI